MSWWMKKEADLAREDPWDVVGWKGLAVFVLYDGREVVWVGSTSGLRRRLKVGRRKGNRRSALPGWTMVKWKEFEDEEVREAVELERRLVWRLKEGREGGGGASVEGAVRRRLERWARETGMWGRSDGERRRGKGKRLTVREMLRRGKVKDPMGEWPETPGRGR